MPNSQQPSSTWEWDLQPGVYTARELVREAGTLLAAIEVHLGDAADASSLLDNVQASLAVEGREAVLPLGTLRFQDHARGELAAQAARIGEAIARLAREHRESKVAFKRYGTYKLSGLMFRSRCDSHLWTPQAAALLTGPSGGPVVMQLFNEYVHQLILLRDILLPFDNWEEVRIEIPEHRSRLGLRHVEPAREQFLSELMIKQVPHRSIVRYAQAVLSPQLSGEGYGFRYRRGIVLPSGIGESSSPSRYLLRWHAPGTILSGSSDRDEPAVIAYSETDYYSAPRSAIGPGAPGSGNGKSQPRTPTATDWVVASEEAGRIYVHCRIRIGSQEFAIDLGQISRGYRYSYDAIEEQAEQADGSEERADWHVHDALTILGLPGLVTAEEGTHFIPTGGDSSIRWALLGKLYPENVILLREGQGRKSIGGIGKGFGSTFVID
jgi:hypothetical protein